MIKNVNVNNEIETELRFGIMRQNFNPKIPKENFLDILRRVETYNFNKTISDFVDLYSETYELDIYSHKSLVDTYSSTQ